MSYFYDGPTYGIADSQQADVVAYCKDCGGEIYSMEQAETGLCDYCQHRHEQEEEEEYL